MSKSVKKYQWWIGVGLLAVVIAVAVVLIVNGMKGKESGDVEITGGTTVEGLTCKDTTLAHPAFTTKPALSYKNTVTATFKDDKLSSISLIAEATYNSEAMAEEAVAFAKADYGLTLSNKYGEKSDVFSHSFSVEGTKLQLAQTTRDISEINSNIVTYFLLDQGTVISKTLSGLEKQYENKGFACEKSE